MRRFGGGCEPRPADDRSARPERLRAARRASRGARARIPRVPGAGGNGPAPGVGACASDAGAEADTDDSPSGNRGRSHVRPRAGERGGPRAEAMTGGMLTRTERAPSPSAVRIGPAGDSYEEHAGRVADEATAAGPGRRHWSLSTTRIAAPAVAPASVHRVVNAPGRPLHPSESTYFGRTFGPDLTDVRIHADADAAESANHVGARAYTVGRHIVFNRGEYGTPSEESRHLLAHELTHAVHHRGAPLLRRQPKPDEPATTIRPLVQKFIRGEATEQEKQTLRDLLVTEQLN